MTGVSGNPPTPHTPTQKNGTETRSRGEGKLRVYPNFQGKELGAEDRGVLRVGQVEENQSTIRSGLARMSAGVTYEQKGEVRIYVWKEPPGIWVGPFWALSKEVS